MMNALNLTCQMSSESKKRVRRFKIFGESAEWQDPHLAGHLGKLPADDGVLDQLLPDMFWVRSTVTDLLGLSDTRKK